MKKKVFTAELERRRKLVRERLLGAARNGAESVLPEFSVRGLQEDTLRRMRREYGENQITRHGEAPFLSRLAEAFINPFTLILFALAAVSFVTDVWFAVPEEKDAMTVGIVLTMVFVSGFLRFIQETRSGNAAARLSEMVRTTAAVERDPAGKAELPLEELAVGDIVHLAAGDMVPADVRILRSKDLFISQAALTGESEPLEKSAAASSCETLLENPALAFFGSNIVSGTAVAVVLAVGDDTVLGGMAGSLDAPRPATGFEKGVNSVSWVLIRFMLVMVPVVLFLNGFTKGNWQGAFLFAVSIAVGLTPEMLPMIVTTCLAKGAVAMSKRKCIIKNLNSIQNFGAMDILCTDKTGTLTQDKVVLEIHMDIHGNEDLRVLRHAFLNSFHQTGLRNLMDVAIIEKSREMWPDGIDSLIESCEKVDEIPFDFERRRMSVVVADRSSGKTQMITKGAVEEMLAVSSHVEYRGRVEPLTDEIADEILRTVERFNDNGMRVIAVAQKNSPSPVGAFSVRDEADMVLIGYLAFLDPPKSTTEEAIRVLGEHGVAAKVLTGDNDRVTRCICRQVKFGIDRLLLGSEIEHMDDGELAAAAEKTNVFAKLSPQQKARIVEVLRRNGHAVGFLGDGINDAAAMKAADVGISVDTAVDIARESADIILLEKDLMVLESGILEGRRTYANMIKYIKMTASSNFGNMFSVLIASAFLPFLPMLSMQLLLLNLIYDISCTAIPWDNVDADYLKKPRTWDASSVAGFMLRIGPSSSVFDITTYLLMFYVICPAVCGGLLYHQLGSEELREYYEAVFQAGWFIESMWSQSLVIHLIRTPKLPFLQSRASFPVFVLSGAGIALATALPFTGFGERIGLAPLPGIYFGYLALTLILYMALTQFMKRRYIRRYGELL